MFPMGPPGMMGPPMGPGMMPGMMHPGLDFPFPQVCHPTISAASYFILMTTKYQCNGSVLHKVLSLMCSHR